MDLLILSKEDGSLLGRKHLCMIKTLMAGPHMSSPISLPIKNTLASCCLKGTALVLVSCICHSWEIAPTYRMRMTYEFMSFSSFPFLGFRFGMCIHTEMI